MRWLAVLVVLVLASCSSPPPDISSCRKPPSIPAAPPRVRTPERMAQFAVALELAREAERARGDECSDKLDKLNAWVKDRPR